MLSLRDKLKAISSLPSKEAKPLADDCLIRETLVPLSDFSLTETLSSSSLALLSGKNMEECRRENICFLDTETTGLSHGAGTVAFLVGIGFFAREHFVVRQYLMRDYDEEVFLLSHVAEHMASSRMLCTFNGASFDLPLLESRYTLQRMREIYPEEKPHLDLLPIARRVWKMRLKTCNLRSVEEAVLHLFRKDDLPGALVPQQYFSFLKTKDVALLEGILQHNAQDIISLAHILDRLVRLHDEPLLAQNPEDLFSLGRVWEKRGKAAGARLCYRAADKGSVSLLARGKMADSYRRAGDWEAAAQVYATMIASRQGGIGPLIALAKLYEHHIVDLPMALEYTRRAIVLAGDRPETDMVVLQKRYQRLLKKARKE